MRKMRVTGRHYKEKMCLNVNDEQSCVDQFELFSVQQATENLAITHDGFLGLGMRPGN